MSEANLNVDGVTPLMHNALIAQYDAIVAAVRGGLYSAECLARSADARLTELVGGDGCTDAYDAMLVIQETIRILDHHDPRKGAE